MFVVRRWPVETITAVEEEVRRSSTQSSNSILGGGTGIVDALKYGTFNQESTMKPQVNSEDFLS